MVAAGCGLDGAAGAGPDGGEPPVAVAAVVRRTLVPVADAFVEEARPTTNRGGWATLHADASEHLESYLRFDVTGVGEPPTRATLRLWATNGSVDGPAIYPAGTAWTEGTLTWSNRPPLTGPAADDRGAVVAGAWVEYDVTSLVTGDGPVAFALVPTSA